jgi:holo-[acyl-carrier protein] synthase
MIVGLGTDLVRVPVFAEQLAHPGSAFLDVTFTDGELAYSQAAPSREPPRHLAARFAAKEAAVKALDVACARLGVRRARLVLREIEVVLDAGGRPALRLHGAAAAIAEEVGADRAWVSLTHDGEYAAAVVALERIR